MVIIVDYRLGDERASGMKNSNPFRYIAALLRARSAASEPVHHRFNSSLNRGAVLTYMSLPNCPPQYCGILSMCIVRDNMYNLKDDRKTVCNNSLQQCVLLRNNRPFSYAAVDTSFPL